MSETDDKAIRVLSFSGKQAEWAIWSEKFLARARRKGYRSILLGNEQLPSDSEDVSKDKKKQKLRNLNELAYEDLILSIDGSSDSGRVAFQIVRNCKTDELKEGDSSLAWKKLSDKFEPKIAPNRLKLKNEFYTSKLKGKDNPDTWIASLEDIRFRLEALGSKISEEDLMEHVLNNLPKDYEISVSKLEDRLGDPNSPLTIEQIQQELNLRYERLYGSKKSSKYRDDTDNEETALFAGGFKGQCNNCGKRGHKAINCRLGGGRNPSRSGLGNRRQDYNLSRERNSNFSHQNQAQGDNSSQSGRGRIKCRFCGRLGHIERNCFRKQNQFQGRGRFQGRASYQPSNNDTARIANDTNETSSQATPRDEEDVALIGYHQANNETKNPSADSMEFCDQNSFNFEPSSDEFGLIGRQTNHQIFIGDSGASCHMVNSDINMFDTKIINEDITIGNGESVQAVKVGKLKIQILEKDGSTKPIILTNVKYIPELGSYNLLSITYALSKGFQLSNSGETMILKKNKLEIRFDHKVKTKTGYLGAIRAITNHFKEAEPTEMICQVNENKSASWNINMAHKMLGHLSKEATMATAKFYGVKIHGNYETCEECALAKARQKNLNKESSTRSNQAGERLFIDISSISYPSFGGARFWLLIVDDFTDYCWSYFMKNKSDLSSKMQELIQELKTKQLKVKYIRCDNAGENQAFEQETKQLGWGIKFEYTAPRTPQQNGRVERKFATLYGRVRAMMNAAGLLGHLRHGLWAECAATATTLENLTVTNRDKPSHNLLYKEDSTLVRKLGIFGEMVVVTQKNKIQGKLKNPGKIGIFIGYAKNHPSDTYRILNLESHKVITSRDVRKLGKTYGKWKLQKLQEEDFSDEDELKNEEDDKEEVHGEKVEADKPTLTSRGLNELRRLADHYNPKATQIVEEHVNQQARLNQTFEELEAGREIVNLAQDFMFFAKENLLEPSLTQEGIQDQDQASKNEVPTTFDEAWNNRDPKKQEKWREAINKEFSEMSKKKVWIKINRQEVPQGRRCVKCKWVFNVKRNGIF